MRQNQGGGETGEVTEEKNEAPGDHFTQIKSSYGKLIFKPNLLLN